MKEIKVEDHNKVIIGNNITGFVTSQSVEANLLYVMLEKLDKIIELLEFRNNIYQVQQELKPSEFADKCTCHKKGKTTANEYCPVHDFPYNTNSILIMKGE